MVRGGSTASGDEGPSIPDEEWERFLRDAESGSDAAPKEPSARSRAVARRLREQPPAPTEWRVHRPPSSRKGKGWYVAGLLVAALLIAAVLAPGPLSDWFDSDPEAPPGRPLAAESAPPEQAPAGGSSGELPTAERPFRGSPAERWADGAAGIHLPEAQSTGWMSRKQVADALRDSRNFLTATSLAPATLKGDRPEEATALINPEQRDMRSYLSRAFASPGPENDPLLLFSRFDPAVRLVGDVVKTRGRLTYREGERGALEVSADVTFVYAAVRAGTAGSGVPDGQEVARTVVRREIVMSWDDPSKVVTEAGTFSLLSYTMHSANGGCGPSTGFFLPEFSGERTSDPSGPAVDPYDRSRPLDERVDRAEGACGTATRT